MAATDSKSYVILSVLFLATMGAVHFAGEPDVIEQPSIRLQLPEHVGRWKGSAVVYCQNETCRAEFHSPEFTETSICPHCGGELDTVSLAEKRTLPKDTLILKKEYRHPLGESVFVTVVVTSAQRAGIHRPQWCLPAQGYAIQSTQIVEIPLAERKRLSVALLNIRNAQVLSDGHQHARNAVFAYWFVSKGRETPDHLQRILWTAFDNIFRGVSQRWAYISVITDRREGSDEHIKRLGEFIAEFYPLIKKR